MVYYCIRCKSKNMRYKFQGFLFAFALLFAMISCKKEEIVIQQPDPEPVIIDEEDTTGSVNNQLSIIRIELSGMLNTNGKINVALYNNSSSFNNPEQAYRETFPVVTGLSMVIEFNDILVGDYAFALYHDANSNNQLDQNWLGIPQEGFAFSNNSMGTFGPPSFNQAKFNVPASSVVTQIIELQHF
jgi:uncharacterized protein (DUF2141 family)